MISPYKKNQHKKPLLLKGKAKIQRHTENLGAVERRKKNQMELILYLSLPRQLKEGDALVYII